MDRWFVLDLNPEPWATGTISTGRRNGKSYGRMAPEPTLVAYQEAAREVLREKIRESDPDLEDSCSLMVRPVRITFFFWRQIESYVGLQGKVNTRNVADVTNLQKALEDALQGTVIENDRQVADIRSVLVEQDRNIRGKIVIRVEEIVLLSLVDTLKDIPPTVWEQLDEINAPGSGTPPLLDEQGEAAF
jgi:Holliday junction resolvase RusA-like endonuclease